MRYIIFTFCHCLRLMRTFMTFSLSLLYAPATKVTKVTLASEAHHHMIFIRLLMVATAADEAQ